MSDDLNPFGAGGPPVYKFNNKGDAVQGTITKIEYREATEPDGTVKRFEDGKPMPVVVVTLDDEVRDFVSGRSVSQFRHVVHAEEGEGEPPQIGAFYRRELVGFGDKKRKGYSPEKLYKITYQADGGAPSANDDKELV